MSDAIKSRLVAEIVSHYKPCPEAARWALKQPSLRALWERCESPEWMLSALEILDYRGAGQLRRFAAACSERHAALFCDDRGSQVLHVVRLAADGVMDSTELMSAWRIGDAAAEHALGRSDWSVRTVAAIRSARDAASESALEAAKGASKYGLLASACIVQESRWQTDTLRAELYFDIDGILDEVRRNATASE